MTEPVFSNATERMFERLPDVYRREDAEQDWALKRFLSGPLDQLGEIETLTYRFAYEPPPYGEVGATSDLVDPATADVAWLPWLAQIVGVRLLSSVEATARAQLVSPAKFRAGTKAAIKEAARGVLTGEQHIEVYDHSTDVSALGAASEWSVLIVTRATETLSDPTLEVIRLGAKPAGIKLYHRTYTTTWDAIQTAFPTWADMEGKTWNEIEEAGL